MQEPAIGVVIPHLNQEDFLRRCLASLAAQTGDVPSFEIFVVDNGSRRMPEAICEEAGVSLILQTTPGPGPARNKGAALSTAPLLAFIDSDCLAAPGWLAAIASRFADPAVSILGGDVRIAREDSANATPLEAYEGIYAYRMKEYIEKQGFTGTGNLAVRREVLESVGPFGGVRIAEDLDWGQRSGRMGYSITYAEEMLVYHPARKTMAELHQKWDRHIAHQFEEYREKSLFRLRWLAYLTAIGASPLGELRRIAASDRISGFGERFKAFRVLVAIRLYRFSKMLSLLLGKDSLKMSGAWNRD